MLGFTNGTRVLTHPHIFQRDRYTTKQIGYAPRCTDCDMQRGRRCGELRNWVYECQLRFDSWLLHKKQTTPICSMYGIFTYIYPKNGPNVGKYSIHGAYGTSNTRNISKLCFRVAKTSGLPRLRWSLGFKICRTPGRK